MTREIIRCTACNLNQFVPESMKCRRCHAELVPKPIEPLPIAAVELPSVPSMDTLTQAVRLTLLARRGKISQSELAKKMGIFRAHVSRMESGRATPTLYSLQRYACAFGISTYELVREIETMQRMLVLSSERHEKEVA